MDNVDSGEFSPSIMCWVCELWRLRAVNGSWSEQQTVAVQHVELEWSNVLAASSVLMSCTAKSRAGRHVKIRCNEILCIDDVEILLQCSVPASVGTELYTVITVSWNLAEVSDHVVATVHSISVHAIHPACTGLWLQWHGWGQSGWRLIQSQEFWSESWDSNFPGINILSCDSRWMCFYLV